MKIVKKILIAVAVLIAIPLIAALFIKKEYTIERQITINKPNGDVYNYIKFQKNQDHYNKWVMMDPQMKKDYRGTDGSVGFVYAWDSDESGVGKGEQEIKSLTAGEQVQLEIRFKKPFESTANTHMTTETVSTNATKVKWSMTGKSNYPFNFMNLFMDKMLGGDLEKSLTNLKSILEQQ